MREDVYEATTESHYRLAAAAWVLDRAEQYDNSSPVRAALDEIMQGLADGEHWRAYRHGELDDLLDAPFLQNALKGGT